MTAHHHQTTINVILDGLTYVDAANNTNIAISEADLTTYFFPNNNGPGIAAVEIFGTAPTGEFIVFVTNAVTLGATEAITATSLSLGHFSKWH